MTKRLCIIGDAGAPAAIPDLDRKLLLGRPLVLWAIHEAARTGLFDVVAVASDDRETLRVATAGGADMVLPIGGILAADTDGKLPRLAEAFAAAENRAGRNFDVLVCLNVAFPLREASDVSEAVRLLEEQARASVVSGSPIGASGDFPKLEMGRDGTVTPLASGMVEGKGQVYQGDRAIGVWQAERFRPDPVCIYADTALFPMPAERSRLIATPLDFDLVELSLRRRLSASTEIDHRRVHDLSGRIALVTGGAGILGRHCCNALASHGARVVVADMSLAVAQESARELTRTYGPEAMGIALDVSDPEGVRRAVASVEAEAGPIDILHNNAASKGSDPDRFFDPPAEFDPAVWREIMGVNIDGYFYVGREVGVRMASRGSGTIVQMASIYGVVGPDQRIYEGSEYMGRAINTPAVYSASKAAVIGLTRYFATYWGGCGVRVNTLTPGGIFSGQNAAFERRYSEKVPLGRMGKPEEIASALVFLSSDASSYVTGQNLIVDGGMTIW